MTPHDVRRGLTVLVGAALLSASLAGCATVAGISDPPTGTVGGAVSGTRAQSIAAEVMDTAQKAAAAPGADGDTLRDAAYTGDALTAAKADAKLAGTLTQDQKDALALTPAAPVVLAVSNGLSYPRSMVVQTTRSKSGLPVLSLLVTPDVRTPFKIAASAPMLPATEVPAFDQVTQGAPSLGDDAAGLAVDPATLAGAYAASLAYPTAAATGRPAVHRRRLREQGQGGREGPGRPAHQWRHVHRAARGQGRRRRTSPRRRPGRAGVRRHGAQGHRPQQDRPARSTSRIRSRC